MVVDGLGRTITLLPILSLIEMPGCISMYELWLEVRAVLFLDSVFATTIE